MPRAGGTFHPPLNFWYQLMPKSYFSGRIISLLQFVFDLRNVKRAISKRL